jgi:SSS family transporter
MFTPLRFLLTLSLAFFASVASRAAETPPAVTATTLAPAAAPFAPELVARVADRWIIATETRFSQRTDTTPTWTPLAPPSGFTVAPASAGVGDGRDWIVVGGNASAAVTRLSLTGGLLSASALPPLPAPRSHPGVGLLGRVLHVVGGLDADGRATSTVFTLDLAASSPAWQTGAPFPGGPVSRPAVAPNFKELLVLGGLDASGSPSAAAWSYRANPVDGTTTTGWIKRQPAPAPLARPSLAPAGSAHFLAFDAATSSVAIFNSILDTWFVSPGLAALPGSGVIVAGASPELRLLARDASSEIAVQITRARYDLGWLNYLAIGVYFVAMVYIGLRFSGKGESSAQFALGNRDVKWWAAGISMFATGASSISFMAIPAMAFATNLVWFFPGIMMIAGFFLQAYLLFPLLRRLQITSTYEYLDRRFNRSLRLLASAQCVIFQTLGRMSVIMVLPSLAISAFTGMDVTVAVLLMGVLTTIYTAIGGFNAVIWTDVFQGVLMIAAPLLVIGYGIAGTTGGFSGSLETALAYQKLNLLVTDWDFALPMFWMLLIGTLFTVVGVVGDQPVIQRVFSVPLNEVRRTALMSTICGITISIFTYGMGVALFGFFRSNPQNFGPGITNDQIVPLFIVQNLPAGICGLVISSIFAAAMSTLSSSMNSVATLVAEDFYRPLFPHATDAARLRVMKLVSYGVGAIGTLVAVFMAKQDVTSMFATWNKVIALLGGGFVGIYILGVFTTRANSAGAIAGGVASIVVTLVVDHLGAVHWAAYSPVAIATCLIVGYAVSLVTGGSTKNLAGLTAFTARS